MRLIPATAVVLLLASTVSSVMAQKGKTRPVIALASIERVPSAEIEALVKPLRKAFDAEVVVAAGLELPASAFDKVRDQYLSTALLDLLARARRPEWERLLGIVDVDLYVPQLNFVFGKGDPRRGVAVSSLARLRSPDEALFHRRSQTEAIHELGHAYGLAHCDNPRCVMWFSNSLAESDRKGTSFCSLHAAQLARLRGEAVRP